MASGKTIIHIHVRDKKNKGDAAIVLAVQEALRQRFPGCRLIDLPVECLKKYDARTLARINSADLAVVGGGGIFYRYFLPFSLKMMAAIKTPIIIFGVGYIREIGARSLQKSEIAGIVALARRAKLIGVRDYYTKTFLARNKIAPAKIEVIGDPAILLKEIKPESTGGLSSSRLKIGLNLNYSGWLGFGKWRDDILAAYRETAEYFQKNFRAQIYYLKHHPGEDNIWPDLKIKNLKIVDWPPREQKYLYGRLDLVIGMMLHSAVLAFGALTPEINVAYDLRNRSFARFISCPELVVDLKELKRGGLLKKARSVLKKEAAYRRKFAAKVLKIKIKQAGFLNKITLL